LWDDVEVNMLWLDSAYPLDKPESAPGVRRGDCPGGVESTPTYVRQNYPDGWVSFQNAFVGPLGSFVSQPPPPPPTPAPCVAGCTAAIGKHQPECTGRAETRCQQMMQYEKKCQWTSCPVPRPTPAPTFAPTAQPTSSPTPPPSPTPQPCRMEDATVPAGKRCKGKPVGGWGSLGKGLTADECKQACVAEDSCNFAAYKQGTCSHFKVCKKHKRQAGFTVWRKDCEAGPSPNPACIALCDLVDLTAGGETCDFLSRFPALCNQTRVRDGTAITPCRATSTACLRNTWDSLQCPRFDEQCAGPLGLSEQGSLTVSSPLEGRRLTKWRFNKWRALIQTSQSVWRKEL